MTPLLGVLLVPELPSPDSSLKAAPLTNPHLTNREPRAAEVLIEAGGKFLYFSFHMATRNLKSRCVLGCC